MLRPALVLTGLLALSACATSPRSTEAAGAATMTAAATTTAAPVMPQYLTNDGNPARGALSPAVRVGNMLYLSGQLGTGGGGERGITPETQRTMENIKALLERNGSSLDRVVHCTVMLVDIGEWAAMNAVYVTFFPNHKPARSAFGVSGLVGNARVEIECMATVG
jgi:2-iminobutanoate/2-iminopropanoate deaminase